MKQHLLKVALSLLLAGSAGIAQAQATRMMMPEGTYDIVVGAALGVTFKEGSEGGTRGVVVPALSVQWSNGVFIDAGVREAMLGVYLSDDPSVQYGAIVSVSGRDQRSDTPGERGGMAFQGGGFINWRAAHNIVLGGVLQAGGGFDGDGLLGHAYAQYSLRLASHHGADVRAGLFMSDHPWMQGYFGVTPAQASQGGGRAYRAPAGLVSVYGDLGWNWQVSNKYWLSTGARLSRLAGPAASSPLVGTRCRLSLRTALTYHF
ncbi:MAG: MipA/OmpV family protein [Bdellovibrionales bacterium]|nr:MipA/OmpV family protein [Massilia sp.]